MLYEEHRINELLDKLTEKYHAGEIYSFLVSHELRSMIVKGIREAEYGQACRDGIRRGRPENRRRLRHEVSGR